MASTFPVIAQLSFAVCTLLTLVVVLLATGLRKYIPFCLKRPCRFVFPSRAVLLGFTLILGALILATVIQLIMYPPRKPIVVVCIVLGRLGAWGMSATLFLSLRPVAHFFNIGLERMIIIHGLIGIIALLASIVHGILPFYFKRSASGALRRGGLEAAIGCGLLLLSLLFAIVYRLYPCGYRIFRVTHWLVYPASCLFIYHLYAWGKVFSKTYSPAIHVTFYVFIMCLGLSFLERLRELYVAMRQWLGTKRSTKADDECSNPFCCRIEALKPLSDDTSRGPTACMLSVRCPIKPSPGQWVYLFLPGMDIMAHAYSTLPSASDGIIHFLISGKGLMTRRLLDSPSNAIIGKTVMVQGPYGVNDLPRQLTYHKSYCIFICGGTGVAPVASNIQGFPKSIIRSSVSVLWHFYNADSLNVIYPLINEVHQKRLIYSGCNTKKVASFFLDDAEDEFSSTGESDDSTGVPFLTYLDNHSIPDAKQLERFIQSSIGRVAEEKITHVHFFLCGPVGLTDNATKAINAVKLSDGLGLGTVRIENFHMLPW
ncbi:hypothetical protein FOL47_001498 [Perkinsus chesapeaki]|uniref:FAD-binding FR-type domain-containing protein n=1 Tax=Perkinsus chesapeaki TaxID=330153 RepID=A0A7J6MJ46_PERCH|nr:hypothetical protein FOL47_001498 [Perkinsus chesapeaki]